MNPDRKIDPEKIRVLNIRTLKGSIEAENEADPNLIVEYKYSHTLGTGINLEENLMALKITVVIETFNSKNEPLSIKGAYTHEFTFLVDNLADFAETDKEDVVNIDPMMAATLIGIAYSTIRGIVFTRTQGTSLNAVIMPVIDPKALLEIAAGFEEVGETVKN